MPLDKSKSTEPSKQASPMSHWSERQDIPFPQSIIGKGNGIGMTGLSHQDSAPWGWEVIFPKHSNEENKEERHRVLMGLGGVCIADIVGFLWGLLFS